MASRPANCTVTVVAANNANSNPDPVPVIKNTNDGVQWTINSDAWIFTGVVIAGNTYTPGSGNEGDFSGCTIDNTQPNNQNKKSIMTIDDSLAEIVHQGDNTEYSYTLNIQARDGSASFAYDPKIWNKW